MIVDARVSATSYWLVTDGILRLCETEGVLYRRLTILFPEYHPILEGRGDSGPARLRNWPVVSL